MKRKAFVRYSKEGRIVPGSLIITNGKYPKGPGVWEEVPINVFCCDPITTTTTSTTTTTTSTTTTTTTTTLEPGLRLLFDFSQTESYSNSGETIADLSGNGNNGIFSTGTGNGSPITVTGYSTNGYLNLPGTDAQLSVRLPDSLKPTGVVPFTYIVYMQPNGYGYLPYFSGIISNQYYNGSYGEGLTWMLTPLISPNGQYVSRDQSSVGNLEYSGGAELGTWSVYALKFDGTTTTLYQYYNGIMYTSTPVVDSTPITSYPNWGMFLGLRYNNWLNAKFNYVAMYDGALSDLEIETISDTLSQRIIP